MEAVTFCTDLHQLWDLTMIMNGQCPQPCTHVPLLDFEVHNRQAVRSQANLSKEEQHNDKTGTQASASETHELLGHCLLTQAQRAPWGSIDCGGTEPPYLGPPRPARRRVL